MSPSLKIIRFVAAKAVSVAFLAGAVVPTGASAQSFYGCTWSGVQPTHELISTNNMSEVTSFLDSTLAPVITPGAGKAVAQTTGAWSAPGTWSGNVLPANGDAVYVPANIKVQLDTQIANSITFKSVRVDGCLEFKRSVNTRLRTKILYVAPRNDAAAPATPGGELWIGSDLHHIYTTVTAHIVFPNTALDAADTKELGNGLIAASVLRMNGPVKTGALRLSAGAAQTATPLTINFPSGAMPVGWSAGDKVVITGMRYAPPPLVTYLDCNGDTVKLNYKTGSQDELLTVQTVGTQSVTFSSGLAVDHLPIAGHPELTPYLINLTRRVKVYTETVTGTPNSLPSDVVAKQNVLLMRGHTMFLSPETQIDGVEFAQLGRTDKSRRAINADGTNVPSCSNSTGPMAQAEAKNFKGRYPVHLHHTLAAPASTAVPDIRNSAVSFSPGWAFAQHDTEANLFNNVSFDTFGGAFVTESGSEKGQWVGNIAVRSSGLVEYYLPKNSVNLGILPVNASFDLARTGHGFWLQGRLMHLKDNVAANVTRSGFSFMHRGTDLSTDQILAGGDVLQPVSLRYWGVANPTPMRKYNEANIQNFVGNETFGSFIGMEVVKNDPTQPSDLRSVIENFRGWELNEAGIYFSYTAHYTIRPDAVDPLGKPSLLSRSAAGDAFPNWGVKFGQNGYDLVVADTEIENFQVGVFAEHASAPVSATDKPDGFFVRVKNTLTGVTNPYSNPTSYTNGDQELLSIPSAATPSFAPQWPATQNPVCNNFIPCWDYTNGQRKVGIKGTKSDSISAVSTPNTILFSTAVDKDLVHRNETVVDLYSLKGILKTEGYYQTGSGASEQLFVVWPEHVVDRLTGQVELTSHVIGVDERCNDNPNTICGDFANYPNNGAIDLNMPSPSAGADAQTVSTTATAPVAISVLTNDASGISGDSFLRPTGLTAPRCGSAKWTASNMIDYLPHPGTPCGVSTDSFQYWIRNRQGKPAKGTVTITLQ